MSTMERCFSCTEIGNCTELYVRKPPDYYGPYFPTFERYNPPSSSNAISPNGTVKVCGLCKIYLHSQWQNFESYKMPESRRIYFTKRHDGTPFSGADLYQSSLPDTSKNAFPWMKTEPQKPINISPESVNLSNKTSMTNNSNKSGLLEIQPDKTDLSEDMMLDLNFSANSKQLTENYICCFVCGLPCLKWHAKTAYSSQMLENKEYFPFFEKLDPPQSSIGLTNGATKICIQCEADLSKQWDNYEKSGTDQMSRVYHITNDHSTQFSINNPGRFITNSISNNQLFSMLKLKNPSIKCALCLNKIIDWYKVSWNQRSTGLCVPNLKNFPFQTEGVMVDKIAEEAIICDVCNYFLSCDTQSLSSTPYQLREYKLPKVGYLPSLYSGSSDSKPSTNNVNRKPSIGGSLSAFLPADSYQQMNSQNKRSKTPNLKVRSKTPNQSNEHGRYNSKGSSNQDPTIAGPIIANCHICLHELRDPSALKTLRATANEEFGEQPFFPFLKNLRANSMKNFEFPVCLHCYCNMYGQWRMSQKAAIPIYERKYNHNEFMCTQCQRLYAQKGDTIIVRDLLVCIGCSENRNSEATKSGFNSVNQDTDANTHGLYSAKTKTTVTVTPISNELSVPSLASFNYAETMKQYSKTSTSSTPSSMNNSLGQFVDNFSRNSSIPPDIYYNSKNIFGKSVKRPAVAAVAPNKRQNTPLLQPDSNPTQTDLSHLKLSDLANFPGNFFNHNSAFNPFPGNINASSNNNFALPMFSSNSPFGVPSHSSIGRKHSSSNSDRDYLMKHTASFSSPFLDQKNRSASSLHSQTNPFINWQQPAQQPQPPLLDPIPNFPFPLADLDAFNPNGNSKEVEMAMRLWMMSQNPLMMSNANETSAKFFNSQFMEEMTSTYYQMLLNSSMAGAGRDDLMAQANLGAPGGAGGSNSGSISGNASNTNMQSWLANYQYQQMLQQMIAAYQSPMTSPHQYPHGLNKPPTISNFLNHFNFNDPLAKLYRPDTALFDPILQNKLASNSNGYNDLIKNPDFLKAASFGFDYDKLLKPPPSLNHIPTPSFTQSYPKQSLSFVNNDRIKPTKQMRDESTRSKTPTHSPKPPHSKSTCNVDSKSKKHNKSVYQSDVLDLSQNKITRTSSYAIESLTENAKKCEKDVAKFDALSIETGLPAKTANHGSPPSNGFDGPLNMSNSWANNSLEYNCDGLNKSLVCSDKKPEMERNRLIDILTNLKAYSLVDIVQSMPEIFKPKKSPRSPSSSNAVSAANFHKCPNIWQFYQFFKTVNAIMTDFKHQSPLNTRNKSNFMKELGLEDSFRSKQAKNVNEMKSSLINHINSSKSSKKTKYEIYWTKWILRNLKRRLSLKNKPHLRRSLMRPVLSGDVEVRFCAAKNKHELENLRSIIKILIKYT